MRVTYSEEDYKVYDCKVINYKTGELIEDLSEENINKLFNIEYGKNITEKSWSDKIKLSEINENVIYKYTANSTTQFPKIENSNSVIIEKGEIYGFDWMIDSATISYAKDNNEKQNDKVDKENNNDGNNQTELKKEETDNTVVQTPKLPQTGTSNVVIIMIVSVTAIMIIIWIKSRKLKDIK